MWRSAPGSPVSGPTLIIVGGAVADEPVAARWFRAASPATVQVWVVPHAGHTQGLTTAPRAWEAHVIGFLEAALKALIPAEPGRPIVASVRDLRL
jgi:hypothetical protein